MVQAGQNYAKLGGQYTKEVRFPHGKVSDFVLPPTPSDESNILFQANISLFTHLFKQSKPEQEKSNQSETEHLVLSKELINVNWRTTDEARNVNFQNPCTVANSHLSTPLIEPNFYVQLPHRRGSTVSLETIPFRNRLCRHPRHNFSADTQEVLRGLTLLVV